MIRFLVILLIASANAVPVSLNFSAQGSGGGLGDSNGTELAPGSLVLAGTFSLTAAQVAANSTNHFALLEAFEVLGEARIGTFGATPQGAPGAFSATTSVDSISYGGQRIYLWIFNKSEIAEADSHIILSSSSWTIPSFGSVTCATSTVDPANPSDVFIGTKNPSTPSPTLGGPLIQAIQLANSDQSDNDGDGRPALLEWATGSDPSTSDLLPLSIQAGSITLDRRRGTNGTATVFSNQQLRYTIQTATDLDNWATLDASTIETSRTTPNPDKPDIESLSLTFPPDNGPRRFWRLKIERR